MLIRIPLMMLVIFLSACSMVERKEGVKETTLADLQPAVNFYRSDKNSEIDVAGGDENQQDELVADSVDSELTPSPEKALLNYRALLEVTDDPEIQARVKYRMAGLEMMISERKHADGETDKEGELADNYYQLAIDNYLVLLKQYPDRESNDQLLYQLAKAYDLSGDQHLSLQTLDRLVETYPNSRYIPEAHFRRGEILFSNKKYLQAGAAYKQVVDLGSETAFYQNAHYMHGWSLFKRNQYDSALISFTEVLDQSVGDNADFSALSRSQASLVDDTIRIMSLLFSYQDSGDSIARLFQQQGARHYEYILYDRLGELLNTQERYGDAAKTYEGYIQRYPNSLWSPQFHVKMIAAYQNGGFQSKLLPEKERFVKSYGVYSYYWSVAESTSKDYLRPLLHKYILELAQYYHSLAQHYKKQVIKKRTISSTDQLAVKNKYTVTSKWYREFITTFPEDVKTPGIVFLMAESLFEAGEYSAAIASYEKVAYEYEQHPDGADAGYAAILSYQKYYAGISAKADVENGLKMEWRRQMVDSQLRYATRYINDGRAVEVLTSAAEELFQMSDYDAAISAANRVTEWQPVPKSSLQVTAWLVISHSYFDQQGFQQSELSYQKALALMGSKHKERKTTQERLAASIYRQGEQQLAEGNKAGAVAHFLRVGQVVPDSPIRVNAEYDAATHLIAMESWSRAIIVMNDFRKRYPTHSFAQDIPARLAFAYQETGQWLLAAAELRWIYSNSEDVEVQRQAHYLSAELYDKSGDINKTIEAYRSYAHTYPEPFDEAIEARFKLSEIYLKTKEPKKRRYWLKKLMDADAKAGVHRTERSRYLAAKASSVFAEDARWAFNEIKLTLPLKRSLTKKKKALKKALTRYQITADYGVEEFATQSVFYIGEIYAQLSRDLMVSHRPKGLNELELEQYEILLEEQAFPFEEKSIEIHEANSQRSWQGIYDQWVKQSFDSLRVLLPGRYGKAEKGVVFSDSIY